MPANDAHERLREIGFAMLLTERRPIDTDELAAASGFDDVAGLLDQLGETGWIDRDSDGRLTGSAGLSLADGPHRLHLDETTFRTWCAYDALGIPAALGPEQLWLAARGDDLRSQFCAPTVLLCGAAHGQTWAAAQHQVGQLHDLEAAAIKDAGDWGSCAAAADRLGQSGSVRLPDG